MLQSLHSGKGSSGANYIKLHSKATLNYTTQYRVASPQPPSDFKNPMQRGESDSLIAHQLHYLELRSMFLGREELRKEAVAFCQAFVDGILPEIILSSHFSSSPRITEHGPENPELPFLGKTFTGRKFDSSDNQTCDDYFNILSRTLEFQPSPSTFPSPDSFIVDETCEIQGKKGVVSVVGGATFKSLKTGKTWDEQFMYRLSEFDEKGKIGHWEIWADTLSAWNAVHSWIHNDE